jgi:hypothetical protein
MHYFQHRHPIARAGFPDGSVGTDNADHDNNLPQSLDLAKLTSAGPRSRSVATIA